MTITRPSRVWFTCVSLILFAAAAAAPVLAQDARPTNTDLKFHKFVPPTPPENNVSASAARQATTPDAVNSAAAQQMQLLLQEKSSRTPAQQKIDSNILYTIRMMSGQPAAPGFQSLYTGVDLDDNNRIVVDIVANVTPELLQQLQTAGALVQDSHPEYRAIRALIPANQIETIAALPDVSFIGRKVQSMTSRLNREPQNYVLRREAFGPGFEARAANVRKQIATFLQQQQHPVANSTTGVISTGQGSVTTEGDATHLAARARGVFGINGSGLKIGVLSDSANDTGALTAAQATGDIPPTCPGPGGPCLTILQDSPGQEGTDEGTAMMEIVYDMAPGASLYFATANISESGFASNILALQAAGCNIIVDDVSYFDEPVFQDGMVAQAVNTVTAAGALYFSSAGNEGNVDAGTAGYFEGDFNDAGSQSFPNGAKTGTLHNFGTGFAGDPITSPGEGYVLQWADPFGASGNDYDLFYLNSSGIVIASSTNIQNGTQNPFEFINPPVNANPGDQLAVFKTSAASRLLFALKTFRGTLSVATAGETWGHSAAMAAFSVAAAPAAAAFTTGYPAGPFPDPFTVSNLLEPFTSDGPRRIIFNADGSAITPGNFSSTGGTVRSKPDITAADGVSTTLPSGSGLNPFYGTSAAAPHAASIAALIMSAKPALTPAQIRTTLTSTVLDIMAPGYDRDSGNGIVMAYPALNSLGLTPGANPEILSVIANENPGNGNGIIDPGEGALLTIQLKNPFGVVNATGITGVLTTNTTGVTITQPAVSAFPDIVAGSGIGGNLSPFTFTVASNVPCALNIEFTLTLTYSGGPTPTKALNFSVQTGLFNVMNTLGNSVPGGLPAGVTFATGSQTNRLSRNGVPTTCNSEDNFPGTIAAGARAFDSYSFTPFREGCTALTLTSSAGANLFTSLYQPNFVPSNITTNYLADAGASGSPQGLSFFAFPSDTYTIVVNDSSPSGTAAGTNYNLQIPSCLLTNPSTINQVPVAVVQNVTVTAATIGGTANASIDNGSFSPSGDPITKTQTPPGPYTLGVTSVTLTVVDSKGATAQATATVTVVNPAEPDMTISSSHFGNFVQGQTGATYTITATNIGGASTTAAVSVVDTLPSSITATAISGTGWVCTLGSLSCTRSDALQGGVSYPPITLTVNVAVSAPASATNSVSISGGGELNTANDSATDPTTITAPSGADMTITKTHVGNFVQGTTGTYTITATNNGTAATVGLVTVADALPPGLTVATMAGTGWTCVISTVICTRSDSLANGASYPAITLTVSVSFTAPASATNNVIVAGGGEVNSANDTASDVTTIFTPPTMRIAKSHVGNFTQGQVGASYTLTVTNISTGAATSGNVNVTEFPPSSLTPLTFSGSGWTCNISFLTCNRNDVLAAGGSYPPLTFSGTVAANAPSSISNTAQVSGGGDPNFNPGTNSVTDVATVTPVADLTITKHHVDPFIQGQIGATFTIVASNSGPGPTSGTVTVVDTLPAASFTPTAIAGNGWTCTLASLTCTRNDVLAVSASYPAITLTVNVPTTVGQGSLATNTATVSGGDEANTANDVANDQVTFQRPSDLIVSSTHSGNFNFGQVGATYSLTVTNISPQGPTFGAVTVVDSLPTGLTATAMGGTGWACTLGTLTCSRSDMLQADNSFYPPVTLTVNVSPTAPPSVTNVVTVSGGGETNFSNDSSSDPTTIVTIGPPDLTVASTHVGNFSLGEVGAPYTVTVTNVGNGPTVGNVTVTDVPAASTPVFGIGATGWNCSFAGSQQAICTRSDVLAPGASYPPITVEVSVSSTAPATVTNTVTVTGGGETNTSNDSSTDPTIVTQPPDLTITETHSGNFTQGGQGVGATPTYTIVVTDSSNGFTSPGFFVTVVDTLPPSLRATAIAGAGWNCTLATLTCVEQSQLAAGASYSPITISVAVAANAPASVTNIATVSGGGEVNTANDTASDVTTITQLPDMTISAFTAPPGSFLKGQTGAQFAFTATNSGAGPTSAPVSVAVTLPAALTASAIAGTGWTCTLATVTCTRADVLQAGQPYAPILLTMNVDPNAPTPVSTTATVSGGGEVITSNDSITFNTTITSPPSVTLSATSLSFPNQGVNTTSAAKQITVTNNGGQTLTFAGIAATLLSNTTNWAIAPGTTCANGVSVAGGGGQCVINITFTPTAVGSFGPDTLTLNDNATPTAQNITLTGTGIDFSAAGPVSPVTITAGQTANFTISLTPGAGGFANTVTFSASGLPSASSASFSPSSLTPGGTATSTTLSIFTTARGILPPLTKPNPRSPRQLVLWLLAALSTILTLSLLATLRRTPARQRRFAPAMLIVTVLLTATVIAGCGGGGVTAPPAPTGTPAGTSIITVTAQSGTLVHTTSVTLTVQ